MRLAPVGGALGPHVLRAAGQPVGAHHVTGVVDLHVAAIALRRPGGVARVAFQPVHVRVDRLHGDATAGRELLQFRDQPQRLQFNSLPPAVWTITLLPERTTFVYGLPRAVNR